MDMVKNQLQRLGMVKAIGNHNFRVIGGKGNNNGFVFFQRVNVHAVNNHPYLQKVKQGLILLYNNNTVCRC